MEIARREHFTIHLWRILTMPAKRTLPEEQYKLIQECRASGLTDYQWCKQNDIHPGTFYNWVSRLRKRGYIDTELYTKSVVPAPLNQDVVCIASRNAGKHI